VTVILMAPAATFSDYYAHCEPFNFVQGKRSEAISDRVNYS